ncbi:MAG: hypothetical protein O2840_02285 [bacterium]|nr:hypothetical protein [bacterium]
MGIIPAGLKKRLTVLDIIFGVLIIAVLGFFLIQRLSQKSEWVSVTLLVSDDNLWWKAELPESWYVTELAEGMEAKDARGDTFARILEVSVFDKGASFRNALVRLELKVAKDSKRDQYLFDHRPLTVGKPLSINFGTRNVQGLITDFNNELISYEKKRIVVRLAPVPTWIANSYKPGLRMLDGSGRELATLDSIEISPYYEVHYSDNLYQLLRTAHPELKTVIAEISIATTTIDQSSYFVDGAAIKVGERIWFQFSETVIRNAEIIEILE